MKTYIKNVFVVIMAMLLAISLLSCGKVPKGAAENTEPPKEDTENKLDISGKITWSFNGFSEDERDKYEAFVEAFEKKYPEVEVYIDYNGFEICR